MVPDAEVRIINQATGVERDTKTNDAGMHSAPFLEPGHYKITVSADGFNTAISDDLTLNVGQVLVSNFDLKIGPATESITVTGEGPNLNTTDGSVSTVVDRQFVGNLPLNGRSFQSLIALTPGVVLTKATALRQGQFSVNGQRADANYFMVDGVSANIGATGATFAPTGSGSLPGLTALGGTNNLVSVDALQEFQIQTSTFAPEFGRLPGAQISIVTRSGTNEVGGGRKINSAAFAIPSTVRQGTLGRSGLRGFGMWQLDLALRRQFNLAERFKLQFRTEFFNLLNHPNFADPAAGLGTLSSGIFSRNPGFGLSTLLLANSLGTGGNVGGFNPLYQVGGPRSIQLSLKLNF